MSAESPPASILAIGTANPPNCFQQSTFPDYYFRITNSQHQSELKAKFERICEKSMIKKRYFYLTEELILKYPHLASCTAPSLDIRQDMAGRLDPVIVGAGPIYSTVEKPLFELVRGAQTTVPGSEGAIVGRTREAGLMYHLSEGLPDLVAENIEACLVEAFEFLGVSSWNSIFWAVHPGGPKILDKIEARLDLGPGKLGAARHVLAEYGNMWSGSVVFVLDEIRKSWAEHALKTSEGWGVLLGFGPGLTIETMVLRSVIA
ncbi:unnamed protein product [Linum trigynum]|uniref:Chalcone synthase n=1 Tax=Linum trigynum TaxID=586398 RepID=A0AAV2EXQ7_9ROSI